MELHDSNHEMPTIFNMHTIIDASVQLVETLSSSITSNENRTCAFNHKHSKQIQSLSSILPEIENKHENIIGMKHLIVNPYCMDSDQLGAKHDTKVTTSNISALITVSPSVSALSMVTKHARVPVSCLLKMRSVKSAHFPCR